MACEVFPVHVANLRKHGYPDLEAWIADAEHNVYVDRRWKTRTQNGRFPPHGSPFANPYKPAPGDEAHPSQDARDCVRLYESYMRNRLAHNRELLAQLAQLRGKRLGCWCKPGSGECHAEVLARFVAEFAE